MKMGHLVMGLFLASAALATDATFAQQTPPPEGGQPGQTEGDGQRGPGARGDRGSRGGPGGDAQGGRGDRRGDGAEGRGGRGGREGRGGQGRGRGWGDPSQGLLAGPASRLTRSIFQPDYMTRDLALIVERVRLDNGQRDVVEMLLEDYDANFQLAVEETTASMSDLGADSGAGELEADRFDQLRDQMESMREEMRAARDAAHSQEEVRSFIEPPPEPTEEQRAERDAIRQSFRERMMTIRNEFRSVRELQMKSDVMQDLLGQQLTLLKQFTQARDRMGDEATGAITAILSEPQLASWDDVQRQIRRMRLLPSGRLQGERTDIMPLTDPITSSEQDESAQAIRDVVTSWELDLDAALLQRQAFDETGVFLLLSAMSEMDYEQMLKTLRRRQVKAEAVRDVTDAAIDLIAASLPAEQGEDFRRRAIQNGYDRVFHTTRSQRAITAATELEDLDEELLAAVAALLVDCNLEIAAAGENILAVIRLHDEPREVRYIERMIERQAGEQRNEQRETDPIRVVSDERDELDEAYLERLRNLLGEELVATLPGGEKREDRGERGRGGFGGGDQEARRAEFMKQFDANGNGDIDESERAAIREHFRGMGGWGGGPPSRGGPPPFSGS